jgi:hypothetical protein
MKTKMKKYQDGGPADAMQKAMGQKPTSTKKTMKYARKKSSGYISPATGGNPDSSKWSQKYKSPNAQKMQSGGTSGGYPESGGVRQMQKGGPTDGPSVSSKGAFYPDAKCRGEGCPKNPNDPKYKNQVAKLSAEDRKKIGVKYKTGGMVNPNANLQAGKKAGSKGVKSGVNPKAAASKVAKGRSGGTSTAPKTATPKAKYGMSVKKYGDGGGTSKSSMYGGIGRSTGNMTPARTSGTTTMTPVEKAKARYGMTLKKKQDGGPQDYVDSVIAKRMKSAMVQKGMNQARAAAKKGRAGKI